MSRYRLSSLAESDLDGIWWQIAQAASITTADRIVDDDIVERFGLLAEAKRHLRVTGTLGVLRAGAEQGLVDVPDLLERLQATSFYLDDALVDRVFAPWLE